MIADHVKPLQLFASEFLSSTTVTLQNPCLKVPAHRVGVGCDLSGVGRQAILGVDHIEAAFTERLGQAVAFGGQAGSGV